MQCLTFLHESEIAQGNNIPLSRAHYAPTKADRMYMVLDKSGA